jgi:hypothetical protein
MKRTLPAPRWRRWRRWFTLMAGLLVACARASPGDTRAATVAPATALASASATGSTTPATPASASATPLASASTTSSANTSATPLDGADFIAQARDLFEVAACGPGEPPARFDSAVVQRHCDDLKRAYAEYRKAWVDVAEPFIGSLRPKDLPDEVVYPFGGGDLTSALTTFPDALEITTISLEPAGDVRPIDKLAAAKLERELAVHRSHLERLFKMAHSRTDNLEKESLTELPGEILFALGALVVHGDEPTSLRYFRLRPDGTLAYVTQAEIDGAAHRPRALRTLFDNAELRFRSTSHAGKPVQVLRHIAYNLDDAHLAADPSLLAHLNRKGKVAAMTKAASHLLWNNHFSGIRQWLLAHTDWMLSDSTGIPPRYAQPAGFAQDIYGKFNGPALFGLFDERDTADFKRLFASQPARDLPFRYGYPDRDGHAHLIITRRAMGADAGP